MCILVHVYFHTWEQPYEHAYIPLTLILKGKEEARAFSIHTAHPYEDMARNWLSAAQEKRPH